MLGTEPQVIESFVAQGDVKLVFWPVLNHGNPSVYSSVTTHCAGAQNPDKFWEMHDLLFENQNALWSATRDYFVESAASLGLDQAAFEACYDGPDALAEVMALDSIRRDRGVFAQPVFDANGILFAGALPFDQFLGGAEHSIGGSHPLIFALYSRRHEANAGEQSRHCHRGRWRFRRGHRPDPGPGRGACSGQTISIPIALNAWPPPFVRMAGAALAITADVANRFQCVNLIESTRAQWGPHRYSGQQRLRKARRVNPQDGRMGLAALLRR